MKQSKLFYAKTNLSSLKPPLAGITGIFFGILPFLMLLSCGQSTTDKPDSEEFTLFVDVRSHYQIDIGHEDHSHGDIHIFESVLTDKNKNVVGRHTTKQVIVSLPQENNPDQVHEDRFTTTIFEFDDGSTIVRSGISHYPVGQIEMDMNAPRVRAIIGGTGKYIGARGQITTTKIADSSYELVFKILP